MRAELNKGRFTPATMMKVISTPLEKGGCFRTRYTCYEVVAVPELLQLWVRVPASGDWSQMDLAPLFKG